MDHPPSPGTGDRVGGDVVVNHLESARRGLAPRLAQAWASIQVVLDDDQPHALTELHDATLGHGDLAARTVDNLLRDAVKDGTLTVTGRGAERTWRLP
jgi:hypothetical protein